MADKLITREEAEYLARSELRLKMLKVLSFRYHNERDSSIRFIDLVADIATDQFMMERATSFLFNEGLISMPTHEHLAITHKGVKEVEHTLRFPDLPSEYFSKSIVQLFSGDVGAVQNGANTATIKL